jgi:prepilin-type N-terminal cleavage/methylation domain-containing protein
MPSHATRHTPHVTNRPAAVTPSLRFQVSGLRPRRSRLAFTLIELLVVIAIIAILAGLAFPAVQGALESGKKAQARNDVHQIAAAFKAFQLEYGRLPGTATSDGPAPQDYMSILTSSNAQNPRGIVFFEPKMAKQGKGGLDGTVYKDPWGNPYIVTLDYNYDNKITADVGQGSQQYFTTVIVHTTNSTNKTQWISNAR